MPITKIHFVNLDFTATSSQYLCWIKMCNSLLGIFHLWLTCFTCCLLILVANLYEVRFCEQYRFLDIFLKAHVLDDLRVCFKFMWFVALVISINVLNLTCQFICNSLVLWVIFNYVCFNLYNLNLLNFFCKFCPFVNGWAVWLIFREFVLHWLHHNFCDFQATF